MISSWVMPLKKPNNLRLYGGGECELRQLTKPNSQWGKGQKEKSKAKFSLLFHFSFILGVTCKPGLLSKFLQNQANITKDFPSGCSVNLALFFLGASETISRGQ